MLPWTFPGMCGSCSLEHPWRATLPVRQRTCATSQDAPKLSFTMVLPNHIQPAGYKDFCCSVIYSSHFSIKKQKWPPRFSVRKLPSTVFSFLWFQWGWAPFQPLRRAHSPDLAHAPAAGQEVPLTHIVPQVGQMRLDFTIFVGNFGERELFFFPLWVFCANRMSV